LLGEQLKALSEVELNFSLEATGFEMGEIDLLIENLQPGAENDREADALPEAEPGIRVSVAGDLWILGRNRVFCGDSLHPSSYLKIMEGRKAKMVFTDPPCTVPPSAHAVGLASNHRKLIEAEFTNFLTQVFSLLVSQTMEGSIHLVFADWHYMTEVLIAGKQAYGELNNLCFWMKDKAGTGSFYRGPHEVGFVFKAGKDRQQGDFQPSLPGRDRSNVWHYPGSMSRAQATGAGNVVLRPTAKSVPLMADAIVDCSARGDIVLDPFLGTGTTVIAAERTSRICYGIESDPHFVDTTIRRWQTFTGLSAKHASSGRSFREREEEVGSELKH
jgi:DNA methylase